MANTFKFGNGNWAVKDGYALAYNNENGNFKPLPFDFTRASSATRVNKNGLIETVPSGKPRIDFLNNTSGHLLLEPSRTNLFPQSNKFDTDWTLNNIAVTSGQIGVGGSADAWKITANSGSGEKKLNKNLSVSGNHAVSIYAKKGTRDYIWIRGVVGGVNKRTFFNLNTGTIHTDDNVSSNIIDMGDGWYRCEVVINQQSGFEFFIGIAEDDNTPDYNDDGTGSIYVQYAQAEAGSYATSYIPTEGSSVTRVVDDADNSYLGIDYSSSYTLFIDLDVNSISDYSQMQFRQDTPSISYILRIGNSINIGSSIYTTTNTLGRNKFALSVTSGGNFTFYKNGNLITTGSGLSADLQKIINDSSGYKLYDIKLYNTALSDSELQALTSNQ